MATRSDRCLRLPSLSPALVLAALLATSGTALLICLVLTVCGVAAAPNATAQRSGGDLRLEQIVRIEQAEGSIGSYLEALTDRTGVSHAAAAECADRPLIAFGGRARLANLHRAIAANWVLTWQTSGADGKTYRLVESRADRERRKGAREAERLRARRRVLARIEQMRKMAFMSADDLRAMRGEKMVRPLLHPNNGAIYRLAFSLPEGLLLQALSHPTARIPFSSLPPDLQQLAHRAFGGGADPAPGWLQLGPAGTLERPTLFARLQRGHNGTGGNLLYFEGIFREPPEERRARVKNTPAPADAEFKRKVTLREPASRAMMEPGQRPPGAKPLAPLLKDLAAQVRIPILAECEYRSKEHDPNGDWLREQWWLAADIVDAPLSAALDLLCADFDCTWRYEHGFVLIRPRLWFAAKDEERAFRFPDFKKWDEWSAAAPQVPGGH